MIYTDDDGRAIWTNVARAPTYDSEGHVTGVVSVISDIDKRKQAEQELREREADLARVQRIGRVGGLDIDVVGPMRAKRSPESTPSRAGPGANRGNSYRLAEARPPR
jgi:PAS domain-containing protein